MMDEQARRRPLLVFCEQRDGVLKPVGLEALGEASRLTRDSASTVTAVLIGAGIAPLGKTVAASGAAHVLIADDARLAPYSSEVYTTILAEVAIRLQPRAIVMGATAMGKDLAPKLAARLRSGFIQDCVGVEMDAEGALRATRPVYGGKLLAVVKSMAAGLTVLTVRPNVFPALSPSPADDVPIERLPAVSTHPETIATVREVQRTTGTTQELTEASIIVSGGRGLKAPENFRLVEDLADALGATVGASRAAVDAGWKPHAYQVGLTGKTVSPQLYIACGISGAIQHQAGMSSAKTIVAINSNPDAPIFKLATYGIVGDLFEVLPLLTAEVKRLKTTSEDQSRHQDAP